MLLGELRKLQHLSWWQPPRLCQLRLHLADSDNAVRGNERALQDVHGRPVDGRPAGILP